MTFSPDDITSRQFLIALRGYDRDEVDSFLRELAADYQNLLEAGPRAGDGGVDGAAAADPFEQLGSQVAAVIRSANESAEEHRAAAEREATEIRAAAERQAAEIRSAAEREAAGLRAAATEDANKTLEAAQGEFGAATEMRAAAEAESAAVLAAAQDQAAQIMQLSRQREEEVRANAEQELARMREAAAEQQREAQHGLDAVQQRRIEVEREIEAIRTSASQEAAQTVALAEETADVARSLRASADADAAEVSRLVGEMKGLLARAVPGGS